MKQNHDETDDDESEPNPSCARGHMSKCHELRTRKQNALVKSSDCLILPKKLLKLQYDHHKNRVLCLQPRAASQPRHSEDLAIKTQEIVKVKVQSLICVSFRKAAHGELLMLGRLLPVIHWFRRIGVATTSLDTPLTGPIIVRNRSCGWDLQISLKRHSTRGPYPDDSELGTRGFADQAWCLVFMTWALPQHLAPSLFKRLTLAGPPTDEVARTNENYISTCSTMWSSTFCRWLQREAHYVKLGRTKLLLL